MGSKVKTTIAISRDVMTAVDEESRLRDETRSKIIEEALCLWRRQKLRKELAEGYQAMFEEDSKTAEDNLLFAEEVWDR